MADYAVTHKVSWNTLDTASLIFGKNYASGGVDYTLRAPSAGSNYTGLGNSQRGVPQSNEWDTMLNKDSGYIQNWNEMFSWGQDTSSAAESFRAYRGYNSARFWYYTSSSFRNVYLGFRPVLEVLNPDTLGSDGLKVVTLDLNGGKLGGSSDAIHIIVKTGSEFYRAQEVTINATDNSGTVFVSYLVTDQDLSEEELKSLVFSGYEEPFRIDRNGEYIVYAMLVDTNLNITYLRSDRVTVDNVQPVIGGIENGKTYCEAQTVTIDEKYLDTVTVNGTEVTLDENGSFILSAADGEQKIVATDKAGNTAEMTVTVNDGHTGGTATCTEKAVCEICGKAYGDLDGNHHANLKHIPAKAATRTAGGNIEYWYCEDCDKYFADAAATKEIKQADTVTAKLSGAAKSPQTGGDSGVVTVLLLSGGAFICLVSRRKKRTHTV